MTIVHSTSGYLSAQSSLFSSIHHNVGYIPKDLEFANNFSDPWWNTAVYVKPKYSYSIDTNISSEYQAFGRIYRLGQMKNTHQRKTIVLETVDSRLITCMEINSFADLTLTYHPSTTKKGESNWSYYAG